MTSVEFFGVLFVVFWLVVFLAAVTTVVRGLVIPLVRLALWVFLLPFRVLKRIMPAW